MTQEDKDRIDQLLGTCNKIEREMDAMKKGIDFLINEYKSNKGYFSNDGSPTIEDVIKTCYEFGWASCNNFNHQDK